LDEGKERAKMVAKETMGKVKEKVGLI